MNPQADAMTNLDIRCATLGRDLAQVDNMDEKVLNDALAVLEEQGPYAMFLYVRARHDEVANEFQKRCVGFLREVFGQEIPEDALRVAERLACNLDDLLFARELLRAALGYARYHVKTKGGGR